MTIRLSAAVRAVLISAFCFAIVPYAQAGGALAVGACGAYGYAFDFADAGKAQPAALKRCKGKDCNIVMTMRKTCAAYAIDAANVCGAHGYASDRRLGQAQNMALQHCYKFGGKECVIRAFACDAKG